MNTAIALGMDILVNQTSGSQPFVLTAHLVHVRIFLRVKRIYTDISDADE